MTSNFVRSEFDQLQRRDAALAYWRATWMLAAAHAFQLGWPPSGRAERRRLVGHWGCNPGIGWIVGHLASHWSFEEPFLLVVGTGHASSYLLAHRTLAEGWTGEEFAASAERYGQPGGEPSELPLLPGAPYQGGELGAALAVTQALAAFADSRLTVCVVGDGECETPAALAAFAHGDVLLGAAPTRRAWLPVINTNGARMGGPAVWNGIRLERFLGGLGYQVIRSGADAAEASDAAAGALQGCLSGRKVAWISETEKGWPAPPMLGKMPFRGHEAHRPPRVDARLLEPEFSRWVEDFYVEDIMDTDGRISSKVQQTANRVTFSPSLVRCSTPQEPLPLPREAADPSWRSPVAAVDELLASRETLVFCPDEAASNRLHACLGSGRLVEVLSEETCVAWTWGAVEASREAVFATYEAFAPLTSSALAQYTKLCASDPGRDRPPLVVLQTSLGWANSPSHQNTDLAATFLVRPHARLVCPIGYTSADWRTRDLFCRRNSVGLLVVSKQTLLDLPDPGGAAIELRVRGTEEPRASIVAIGDVCVTEAVAVMAAAAQIGLSLRVVAVVDQGTASISARRWRPYPGAGKPGDLPAAIVAPPVDQTAVGACWCAAPFIATSMWEAYGASFPIFGFVERFGATPWETLCANGQDRLSLAGALVRRDLAPSGIVTVLDRDIASAADPSYAGSVPQFDCPTLTSTRWEPSRP